MLARHVFTSAVGLMQVLSHIISSEDEVIFDIVQTQVSVMGISRTPGYADLRFGTLQENLWRTECKVDCLGQR